MKVQRSAFSRNKVKRVRTGPFDPVGVQFEPYQPRFRPVEENVHATAAVQFNKLMAVDVVGEFETAVPAGGGSLVEEVGHSFKKCSRISFLDA